MPTLHTQPAGKRVPSTGARRRVQALMRLGWTARQIGAAAGVDVDRINNTLYRASTLADTHRAVCAAYQHMWDTEPEPRNRWEQTVKVRTVRGAAAKRWAPPAAWDDETIDDPAGRPHGVPRTAAAAPRREERIAG